MIRATYNFGAVGPMSDVFLETYWVPGLWTPLKFGYTPGRPWSFPFANPFGGSPTGGNFKLLKETALGRRPRPPPASSSLLLVFSITRVE